MSKYNNMRELVQMGDKINSLGLSFVIKCNNIKEVLLSTFEYKYSEILYNTKNITNMLGGYIVIYDPLIQFESLQRGLCWCLYDVLGTIRNHEFQRIQFFIAACITFWIIAEYFSRVKFSRYWRINYEMVVQEIIPLKNGIFLQLWTRLSVSLFLINSSGLLPFSQTLSSQLIVILFFSCIAIFSIWVEILYYNRLQYFSHFIPAGVPSILIPLIAIIEFISVLSRIVSLAVRIFANITAGHSLLKIFSIFIFILITAAIPVGIIIGGGFIFSLSFLIFGLEILVAGLQAYVFSVLVLIYAAELV
jgi:ATP synthase subunit 6